MRVTELTHIEGCQFIERVVALWYPHLGDLLSERNHPAVYSCLSVFTSLTLYQTCVVTEPSRFLTVVPAGTETPAAASGA